MISSAVTVGSKFSGAARRARVKVSGGRNFPYRHLLSALPNGLVLIVVIFAAPRIGIGLLTVAFRSRAALPAVGAAPQQDCRA